MPATERNRSAAPARIRDAASLILVKDIDADPRVLLGRRTATSRFMPGKYVFPGGVLQREDFHAAAAGELNRAYAPMMGVRGDRDKATALAKTAIRETLEETGLMLGKPGDVGDLSDPGWRAIKATGLQPCLSSMTYLGLAVTPPPMPLRFNARFFMAPAAEAHGKPTDSDELEDLRWLSPKQWRELPLVSITAYLLKRFNHILNRTTQGQSFIYRHDNTRASITWRPRAGID